MPPMNRLATLMLLGTSLALPLVAAAQNSTPARAKPPRAANAAPAAPAEPPAPLAAADGEQLLAASQVYIGRYDCEYGQILTVSRTAGQDGYVDGEILRRKATFKPVRSSTGAVRLEEVNSGALLLVQIPSKTILMDTKAGKRLVDACQHDEQKREAATAAAEGAKLGIDSPGQISVSGTATTRAKN
jgi:hypothetical protein